MDYITWIILHYYYYMDYITWIITDYIKQER